MIGTEDNHPVAVWEHTIHETLNKKRPDKSEFKCHSDSPPSARFIPPDCVIAMDNELLSDEELHLLDSAKLSTSARCLQPLDLACDVNIDNIVKRKRPQYVWLISRQMVGLFLSVWVRRRLQKHIQNLRVSIVDVGNKASDNSDVCFITHAHAALYFNYIILGNLASCLSNYMVLTLFRINDFKYFS